MKHLIKTLSLILIAALLVINIPTFAQEGNVIAFVNVNVIPMDSEHILEGHTVLVEGGRITAIGTVDEVAIPGGAQVIQADGQYLIPGLTDNHTHVEGMPWTMTLYLVNGVTTIREFNATVEDFELKAAIENGEFLGPHMYNGPSVAGLPVNLIAPIDQLARSVAPHFVIDLGPDAVSGCEDAQVFVMNASEMGADFIKTNLGLGLESFDCIVAKANELGIPVKGHISDEVRAEHFINSGAEAQHATELYPFLSQEAIYDQPARHEDDLLLVEQNLPILVDMMLENNIAFPPTLITPAWSFAQYEDLAGTMQRPEYQYYPPPIMRMLSNPDTNLFYVVAGVGFADADYRDKIRAFGLELIKTLFDAGVTVLAGSDSTIQGGPPYGYALHYELQLFVDAGLTPYEALQTATINSAMVMGDLDEWGTIEVGKRADMVLLNANPLDDIKNTREIAGVMVRGQWLPQNKLQSMLDDLITQYAAEAEAASLITPKPWTNEEAGFSTVIPAGWNELMPGVYARGNPSVDPAIFGQMAFPTAARDMAVGEILTQLGAGELPADPIRSMDSETLSWSMYLISGDNIVMVALAEDEAMTYMIVLQAAPDEFDGLAEQLLVPAIMAFAPAE